MIAFLPACPACGQAVALDASGASTVPPDDICETPTGWHPATKCLDVRTLRRNGATFTDDGASPFWRHVLSCSSPLVSDCIGTDARPLPFPPDGGADAG